MSYPARPVRVRARVLADPDEVFRFVSDTRNDPIWCPNVSAVEQVAGDGVHQGARFRFDQTVEAGGRVLESSVDVEVLEVRAREIEWRADDRFQERVILLEVTPSKRGSTVTQTTFASFKRRPGITRWLYPAMAKRTFRDQFARLAQHFAK